MHPLGTSYPPIANHGLIGQWALSWSAPCPPGLYGPYEVA